MEIIKKTDFGGPIILEPKVFKDSRGYFFESFNNEQFKKDTGLDVTFVQDNESKSSYGVLRGLHFQKGEYAQAKLVRVVKGAVMDYVVDIRIGSPTFGEFYGAYLSEENHRQFFVPRGFAHGFVTLRDDTVFQYKCDNLYNKESEGGIAWDTILPNNIMIPWFELIRKEDIILSAKDTNRTNLEFYYSNEPEAFIYHD